MDKNFKIIVEYDGTDFYGWQKQKEKKTVQGELEKTLGLILNQEIKIYASGRTDAGVHAFGQVANFHAVTPLLPQDLKKGVNSLIKHPVVIQECCLVDKNFHSRYHAVSKEYHYVILNRDTPCALTRLYEWHIRTPLDLDKMKLCCQTITGCYDFKSFENTGSPRSSSVRKIFCADIDPLDKDRLVFKICGSGFLKYMVRNLVGTIVLAGLHKISIETFAAILESKDRSKAGPTAPAHGLFLKKVNYSS